MSELIVLEKKNAMEVFGVEKGTETLLEQIEKKARSLVPDISTEKGRAEIKSFAYDIARTKTALDEMGKELTEDMKKTTKLVDTERKRVRDRLDALKEEVRRPLTEWEEAEKKRVQNHEDALLTLENYARTVEAGEMSSSEIEDQINAAAAVHSGRDWQEFTMRAERTIEDVLSRLTAKRDAAKKREDEQAELARLRAEQEERDRAEAEAKRLEEERLEQERIERMKQEAAEKARKEAEELAEKQRQEEAAKAKAEQERLEQEKADADARAKKAEEDRIAAENKAKADAAKAEEDAKRREEEAAQRERERIAEQERLKKEEDDRRAADKAHRAKINNEVLSALKKLIGSDPTGLEEDRIKDLIAAIAKGEIPHVKIIY